MTTLSGDAARPEDPRMRFLNSRAPSAAEAAVISQLTRVQFQAENCNLHPFQLLVHFHCTTTRKLLRILYFFFLQEGVVDFTNSIQFKVELSLPDTRGRGSSRGSSITADTMSGPQTSQALPVVIESRNADPLHSIPGTVSHKKKIFCSTSNLFNLLKPCNP